MYGYDIVDNPMKIKICRKKTKICMLFKICIGQEVQITLETNFSNI